MDKLSADIQAHFADTGQIGKKYLVNHSAGSGKTLYHLHSPLVPNTDEEEKIYPKGIVSKLLKQVTFEDDGLITVN